MVGAHQKNRLDKGLVEIKKWVNHKDANQIGNDREQGQWDRRVGSIDNDISILVLSEKVELTNNVQPACLPSSAKLNHFKEPAFVSGWGCLF